MCWTLSNTYFVIFPLDLSQCASSYGQFATKGAMKSNCADIDVELKEDEEMVPVSMLNTSGLLNPKDVKDFNSNVNNNISRNNVIYDRSESHKSVLEAIRNTPRIDNQSTTCTNSFTLGPELQLSSAQQIQIASARLSQESAIPLISASSSVPVPLTSSESLRISNKPNLALSNSVLQSVPSTRCFYSIINDIHFMSDLIKQQ